MSNVKCLTVHIITNYQSIRQKQKHRK